jgi:hypothetical protein
MQKLLIFDLEVGCLEIKTYLIARGSVPLTILSFLWRGRAIRTNEPCIVSVFCERVETIFGPLKRRHETTEKGRSSHRLPLIFAVLGYRCFENFILRVLETTHGSEGFSEPTT